MKNYLGRSIEMQYDALKIVVETKQDQIKLLKKELAELIKIKDQLSSMVIDTKNTGMTNGMRQY